MEVCKSQLIKTTNMKKTRIIPLLMVSLWLTGCGFDLSNLNSVISALMGGQPIPAVVTFTNAQGDSKTINLSSSMQWLVSKKPDWLKITPDKGDGPGSVTMIVDIENTGENALEGEIIFLAANGDKLIIKVRQEGDPYVKFKADDTPRWESGATVEKSAESSHIFITDQGGYLFGPTPSSNYKTGRITKEDGSQYEIIEIPGLIEKGKYANCQLHKESGTVTLVRLEVVKKVGDKMWIVFQEAAGAAERRVVQ
jgi:hypothetical protein